MKESLINYLRETVGDEAILSPWVERHNLPLYLTEKYDFYSVQLLGVPCVFIDVLTESPLVGRMLKIIDMIRKQNSDYYYVFLFKDISTYKRKSLIQNRVAFVVENGQMYLPFLGLDLSNQTKTRNTPKDFFSSTTQLVYLFWLYHPDWTLDATDLGFKLGISRVHANRTLNELCDLNLLDFQISGPTARNKIYHRIPDTDYYRQGKGYLKNPVKKTVYMVGPGEKYKYAGLDALSKISMLNPPERTVLAVHRKEAKRIEDRFITDIEQADDEQAVEVQIWQYNPDMLTETDQVDIVSLDLTLEPIKDDRIEQALEANMKGESWFGE